MRVFIVSAQGDLAPMTRKLLSEGHDAVMYIRDKVYRRYIEPDIPLVKSPTVEAVSSGLLVIDDPEAGKFADKARSLNRFVIGGGEVPTRLAMDSDFNERSLHGCGFNIANPDKTEGVLVEVGGWFDGEKYLRPHFLGFKKFRLGTGDVGPFTVGMGVAGKYVTKSRLFTDVLRKTETFAKTMHYVGYVGIDGFINQNSFSALRLNAGFAFPTAGALGELHPTWSTFMLKLAKKEAEVVAVQPDKVVVGVTVLPHSYFENLHEPHFPFCASGQNIEEAKAKVYKSIGKANIPNGYYRIDIGDDFVKNLDILKRGDWL